MTEPIEPKKMDVVSTQLGKRYRCSVCGTEVLALKAGPGRASCCGQIMQIVELKPMESSD